MDKLLDNLKNDYQDTPVPGSLEERGWSNLEQRIKGEERFRQVRSFMIVVFAMFVIGGGIGVNLAQAALPGEILYPLKRTSEQAVVAITGDKKPQVEHRADEIVGLIEKKQDSKDLKQAVDEYKKQVLEVKQELENSGKKDEDFEKQLESHSGKFNSLLEESKSGGDELKEAIEVTEEGKDGGRDGGDLSH